MTGTGPCEGLQPPALVSSTVWRVGNTSSGRGERMTRLLVAPHAAVITGKYVGEEFARSDILPQSPKFRHREIMHTSRIQAERLFFLERP
jgi:hypothetical protein